MNKRITSLMLVFVMILSLLATAVPALAAPPDPTCTYSIEADKTSANPGDTINFTIYMQQTGTQNSMEGTLVIPEGLTFVADSGTLEDGIATTLNWTGAGEGVWWTPWSFDPTQPGLLNGFGAVSYTGTSKLALMKFQCTVDSDATAKDYEVTLIDLVADDENYDTKNPTCIPATVTVTPAPKPATGISLNKSTLELTVGENETLVATVTPADTTDTVTWDTGRSDIATVDSTGKVTAVAPGTAVIAARAGEKSAFCTVTVVAAPCTHTNKTNVSEKSSTCIEKGWDAYSKCDDCGQLFDKDGNEISAIPYLSLAAHKYTANEKKPEALKTAGTCKDKAIYLRSCEVCGKVAPSEAWGTFYGDTDPNNHAGGTTTVDAREPDHKNQVAGYTGDTKCLGCNEIIGTGTSIPAGAHTPSSTWNSDETHHWKECTTMGCGVVIDGSKAEHSSTGANVATCQHKAVCDVCNVEYGALAAHNPASGWTNDASGHWHACQTAGCTEKCGFAAHTPDHEGHATEEYAIKCTECDYVIEAQLGHTHVFDKEVATDAYKASDATCTAKATYYKSCACGEKGTETFEYGELGAHNWTPATCTVPKTCSVCQATEGEPNGHTEGTDWKNDANYHWHICSVDGCGAVIESSKKAHTPDHTGHATEEYAIKCSICDYVIEAQLAPRTPVTNIAATITAPALGETPDYAPVIVADPAGSVDLEEVVWYKIAVADFTGTDEDIWDEMEADEVFEDGYYYSVDLFFRAEDGYKITETTTGTVNGMPHDDTYGGVYDGDSAAYLSGLFEPLESEYILEMPVSIAVKLTGDEKPGKETFKFEIYDLGAEDAEFEILNDTVVAENLAFDENGVAFIEGMLKIKVTGEEQLFNLTEGFKVRMVKGTAKGWTYASEQWSITPVIFEGVTDAAFNIGYDVREIVDGEISETAANGMSFTVGYEAVTEPATEPESDPETPKTGDNSMMVLWIALLVVSGAGVTAIYSRKRKTSAK